LISAALPASALPLALVDHNVPPDLLAMSEFILCFFDQLAQWNSQTIRQSFDNVNVRHAEQFWRGLDCILMSPSTLKVWYGDWTSRAKRTRGVPAVATVAIARHALLKGSAAAIAYGAGSF
jgi:hypothetical protein